MASKKTTPLDPLKLEDLNFDELSMPHEGRSTAKNDRKPIQKIATGFAEGARQQMTRRSFVKRLVSDALPPGYGTAINVADQTVQGARELYNSAAQELRPLAPIARKAAERLVPKVRSFLPASAVKKLEALAKGRPSYRSPSQGEMDQGAINSEMAQLVRLQMEESARLHADQTSTQMLRQDIIDKREKKSAYHFAAMRHGIDRLVSYQDQITARYQQKSLEYQMRSFFQLRDIRNLTAESTAAMKAQLEAVIKNTALPDVQKVRHSEQYGSSLRERLYGRSQQAIVNFAGQFGKRLTANLKSSMRAALMNAQMGAYAGDQLMDSHDMMRDFGVDGHQQAGQWAGEGLASFLGRKAGRWVRGKAGKVPGLNERGAQLAYYLDTLPEQASKWARSDRGEYGRMGSFVRFLKNVTPRFAMDTRLGESPILSADQPTSFNMQTRRSITEVIPGLLSRIHQELRIIRTGDTKTQPLTFNMDRGEFTTRGQAAEDLRNRVFSKANLDMTHYGLDQVIRQVDPENKLSPGAVQALRKQMLSDTTQGRAFDPTRFIDGVELGDLSAEHRTELSKHFKKQYTNNGKPNWERTNATSRTVRSMQSYLGDPTQALRAYMETGNRELLEELGLVSRVGLNDHVNLNRVLELLMGHQPDGSTPNPQAGGSSGSGPSPSGGPSGTSGGGFGASLRSAARAATASVTGTATELLQKATTPMAKARSILSAHGEFLSAATGNVITSMQQLSEGVVDRTGRAVLSAGEGMKILADQAKAAVTGSVGAGIGPPPYVHPAASAAAPELGGPYEELLRILRETDEHRAEESAQHQEALNQLIQLQAHGVAASGGEGVDVGKFTRFGLFGRWGGKAVGGALKGAGWAARGMGQYFKSTYGLIGKTFGAGAAALGGVVGAGRNFLSDVYVKGQWRPALYAKKIRNGDYHDQKTGKVIKRLSQIKGPVVDEQGNVVLSAEDYAAGVFDSRGRALFKGLASGVWGGLNAVGKVYGAMFNLPLTAIKLAGKGLRAGLTFARRPQDVYTPDDLKTPKLYASIMGAGRYFNLKDNSRVTRPADIRGEVYEMTTANEKVVRLNADQMKNGICNFQGKPFKSIVGRMFGLVGGVVRGVASIAGKGVKAVGSFLGMGYDILAGTFKRVGGIFNPKLFTTYSTKTVTMLEKIYTLLDERMRGKRLRRGSWQDQADQKKAVGDVPGASTAAAGATGGGLLAWLKSKFGRKKDEEEEGDDGDNTFIDASTGKPRAKRGTLGRKVKAWGKGLGRKLGRSRLGRLLGRGWGRLANSGLGRAVGRIAGSRAGGLIGRGLGGLGRGAGGLLRAGGGLLRGGAALLGIGELAGTGSAIAGGLASAAGGVASAAGAVGSGLTAAGSAIASVISLPVVLGAAAVAAAGYGIYKGVQYYNLKKSQPLRKVRMAQYGVDLNQNVWPMKKILELEDKLKNNVSLGPDGGQISLKGFDPADLPKIFGIDAAWYNPFGFGHSDEGDAKNHTALLKWFNNRFKPVFVGWMMARQNLAQKIELEDLDDKADPATKLKILTAAQALDSSIYESMDSPFGDDPLTATADTVNAAFKETKALLEAEASKDDKAKGRSTMGQVTAPGLAGASIVLPKATATADMGRALAEVNQSESDKSHHVAAALAAAGAGSISAKGVQGPKPVVLSSTLSSLLAIRLKTYGLTELKVDRVRALYVMESDMLPNLTYDSNGLASFSDKPDDLFVKYAGTFGISPSDPVMRQQWLDWFSGRFLPVMLQFATAVKRANKNVDPGNAEDMLTGTQLLDVANAIVATTGKVKDVNVSVWTATVSPFDNQPLNSDAKSVEPNLLALKSAIKQQSYNEEQAKIDSTNRKLNKFAGASVDASASASAYAGASASAGVSTLSDKSRLRLSPNQVSAGTNIAMSAADGGGASGASVGRIIPQPGKGTGGDINGIPLPSDGATGWDAMKPTIVAAAKMAGVDPAMMATFANIESGFNPTAQPPKGSAKGLFQFTNSTWQGMLTKYASKYGIDPNTSPFDPRANALMGAEFLKENRDYLKRRLGRDPTDTELYAAHFLGAGGAVQMLSAPGSSIAASINPAAAGSNASIFYSSGGTPRTRDELMALLDKKVRSKTPGDVNMPAAELAAAKKAAFEGVSGSADTASTPAPAPTGGDSATASAGATPANPSDATGNSLDDIPKGNGYGGLAAAAAANQVSMPYASTPVPEINKTTGLAMSAPPSSTVNASSDVDNQVDQQRQAMVQQATFADQRNKQVTDSSNQQLVTLVGLQQQQVTLLQQILTTGQQQTQLLADLHGATASVGQDVASAVSSANGNASVADTTSPTPRRGARPFSREAIPAPISVKRIVATT